MKVHRHARPRVEELETRLAPSAGTPWPYPTANWSGYSVDTAAGAVTEVKGTWNVPSVTVNGGGAKYAASWVGIDGDISNTVEQIGTDSDQIGGKAYYYAWYEMYPANYYYINWATGAGIPASSTVPAAALVGEGDTINADVKFLSISGNVSTFQLTITDTPAGGGVTRTFSTTQTIKNAARSSAEWIVEQTGTLSTFSPETFTSAQATINGTTATIGGYLQGDSSTIVYKMDIVNKKGIHLDRTSELNSTGDGFTVYYGSSLPSSAPNGGAHGPLERLIDLPRLVAADVPAGVGSNSIVVAISQATPTGPVAANEANVPLEFRHGFSSTGGIVGRSGVVVAGITPGYGASGGDTSWFHGLASSGAMVAPAVASGLAHGLPGGMRFEASAEPFAAAWSPFEQSAMTSAPTLTFSEEVRVDRLAGALALIAFLPSLQVATAKEEPARVRRWPDLCDRPE